MDKEERKVALRTIDTVDSTMQYAARIMKNLTEIRNNLVDLYVGDGDTSQTTGEPPTA